MAKTPSTPPAQASNLKRADRIVPVFLPAAESSERSPAKKEPAKQDRSHIPTRSMMAPPTTTKQLHERLNQDISQLVQRFENILALAPAENTSHTATAVEENQMEVESTALVRAAEDLLSMTRTMKEMWYFGNLDTLGENEHDRERNKKLEEDVRAVETAVDDGVLSKLVPEEKTKEKK